MAVSSSSHGVSYETAAPNAYKWTEIAFEYLQDGKLAASIRRTAGISTAVVTGTCPYCGDDVNFSQVLDAITGESMTAFGKRSVQPDAGYVPLTVSCCCTEPHTGRPAGIDHGCGINFRADVRQDS